MDGFVGCLVADTGVDRSAAVKTTGIILRCFTKEGPTHGVQALIDNLLNSAAIDNAQQVSSTGSLSSGGVMAAGNRMSAEDLDRGTVQAVTHTIIGYARKKAGENAVGHVAGAISGLGQFV